MPIIASVLKAEISRIARKESRTDSDALKKTVTAHRADIAALKRRMQELERALKPVLKEVASGKPAQPGAPSVPGDEADTGSFRFRASGMASNRKRLGLSAEDFGLLIGASGQSVYLWESGKTKPRSRSLAAIAALRGIGKREAAKRLDALKH